jgi:hypothetical protein
MGSASLPLCFAQGSQIRNNPEKEAPLSFPIYSFPKFIFHSVSLDFILGISMIEIGTAVLNHE